MKISLSYFKSKKFEELKIEKQALEVEEQKLKNKILEKQLEPENKYGIYVAGIDPFRNVSTTEEIVIPYMSVKLIGDVLVIVLQDGSILSKTNATRGEFESVKLSKTIADILQIISVPEIVKENEEKKVEIERITSLQQNLEILNQLNDFDVIDNTVYLKGTNRSIPELLVTKFLEIVEFCKSLQSSTVTDIEILESVLRMDEEYQALKNFFLWCCLNPRAEVANSLYDFLQRNSFRITKQGFFVALRNVVTVHVENENDRKLVEFVSNAYNKIKAVWKQTPNKFEVTKDNDEEYHLEKTNPGGIHKHEWIENLDTLYKNLSNMKGNRYTDAYTGTFDIRVGRVVNMPMSEANWSTQDCAKAGLHFTANSICYVGCGDTAVLCLINPMCVVGIGNEKGRCYEYLPIMTVPSDEATEILHDLEFDTLELDEDYAIKCLDSLAEKVRGGFAAETIKYSFNLPQISTEEINNIVASLEKIKETISKRVSIIA